MTHRYQWIDLECLKTTPGGLLSDKIFIRVIVLTDTDALDNVNRESIVLS